MFYYLLIKFIHTLFIYTKLIQLIFTILCCFIIYCNIYASSKTENENQTKRNLVIVMLTFNMFFIITPTEKTKVLPNFCKN